MAFKGIRETTRISRFLRGWWLLGQRLPWGDSTVGVSHRDHRERPHLGLFVLGTESWSIMVQVGLRDWRRLSIWVVRRQRIGRIMRRRRWDRVAALIRLASNDTAILVGLRDISSNVVGASTKTRVIPTSLGWISVAQVGLWQGRVVMYSVGVIRVRLVLSESF